MSEREQLIPLYAEMAAHTLPECRETCRVPLSCCDEMYCKITIDWARSRWGIELPTTGHPTLPLMGENGCTAAPHLRPICSVHTCQVNAFGVKPNDDPWNKKYFALRERINELEARIGKQEEAA